MIKLENTEVVGWKAALRGMRNPMDSWEKSDTYETYVEDSETAQNAPYQLFVGEEDKSLAKRLVKAGTDHSKFMRMIVVYVDITAPLYWWAEFDTYKVGTVRNSCSKMHKLLENPFSITDFSFEQLSGYKNEIKQFRPDIDEETEIWRKIDCDYDVSNQGRVRHGSRVISGSLHRDGYIFVTIHGKQIPVHRLVALAFVSNEQEKPEVNHIDGNKQNNFALNLEWATRKENQIHAVKNGLQPKKTKTYSGKFTEAQRKEIKDLWDSGESKRTIAKKYGVSHTCICDIVNDKYLYAEKTNLFELIAKPLIDTLNELRDSWLLCDDEDSKKAIWYSILQLLPESYNQKATVMLNYQVLRNIYHARKNHKLDEWRQFCRWIESLPHSDLITE